MRRYNERVLNFFIIRIFSWKEIDGVYDIKYILL